MKQTKSKSKKHKLTEYKEKVTKDNYALDISIKGELPKQEISTKIVDGKEVLVIKFTGFDHEYTLTIKPNDTKPRLEFVNVCSDGLTCEGNGCCDD